MCVYIYIHTHICIYIYISYIEHLPFIADFPISHGVCVFFLKIAIFTRDYSWALWTPITWSPHGAPDATAFLLSTKVSHSFM